MPATTQSRLDHTRSLPDVMTISRCASPASTRHGSAPVLVIVTENVALTPGANDSASGVIASARPAGAQSATPSSSGGVSVTSGSGTGAVEVVCASGTGSSSEPRPTRIQTTTATRRSGMPSTTSRRTQ